MTVNQLKESEEFNAFVAYLKEIWLGKINFQFNLRYAVEGNWETINTLEQAKNKYEWKGNNLELNNCILNCFKKFIQNGIENNDQDSLMTGIKAILRWGDSKNFNRNIQLFEEKINQNSLFEYLVGLKETWNSILNSSVNFEPLNDFNIKSAAGLSKVYSLLLEDFIIYDSRVAAALAYLIKCNFDFRNINNIPLGLDIRLLPYSNPETRRRHVDPFQSITRNDQLHFYSNIIASLIVKSAVDEINKDSDQNITTRDLEAALFMIGYDIRNLPCEAKN